MRIEVDVSNEVKVEVKVEECLLVLKVSWKIYFYINFGENINLMNTEKFIVDVSYEENDGGLVKMPNFSHWFTLHQINPTEGECIFIPEDNIEFIEEGQYSRSTEWYISAKFYEPERNTIIIWCKDFNKRPTVKV